MVGVGYSAVRDGCRCPGVNDGGGSESNGGVERGTCGKTCKH